MFKKALVAIALMLPVTGAFAQTNSNSAIGFYLAQGSTYGTYTCPSTNITPCFVPYGSTVPVSGSLTPAGTQDVNVKQVNGHTVLEGAGATGNGSQRNTVAQDTTTIAGSAPGTAGTPSANVVTIQGITNGTTVPVSGTVATTPTYSAFTSSSALAANTVVCGSACKLTSFNVSADSTLSGAAWWIMVYNATSAPVDGAVTPAKCYAMPSGTTSYSAGFPSGVTFGTGVTIGVSTTGCFTKTASTHAFISGDSQ